MRSLRERRYCACGATLSINTNDPQAIADIVNAWYLFHGDAPHQPATARQAANARRRQEHTLHQEVER